MQNKTPCGRMDEFTVAQHLKAEGNEDFKCGRYTSAIKKYDVALSILFNLVHSRGGPLGEISILFCNKSICYYNLHQWEAAFISASRALEIDPSSIKAYYRRGTALVKMRNYNEAVQTFLQGLELIKVDTPRPVIADVVVGLITVTDNWTAPFVPYVIDSILRKNFGPEIWKLVFEKLASKNHWKNAHILISFMGRRLPREINLSYISMKTLFEEHVTSRQYANIKWVSFMFKWLIDGGANIEKIGPFPLHAIMELSIKTRESGQNLMSYFLSRKPAFKERINEQNNEGYTLLHIVSTFPSVQGYQPKLQTEDVIMLLQMGADPKICDKQNKQAVDYLKKQKNFKAFDAIKRHESHTTSQETAGASSSEGEISFAEAVNRFVQFCTKCPKKHVPPLIEHRMVQPLLRHLSSCTEVPPGVTCDVDVSYSNSLVKQCLQRRKWKESLLMLWGRTDGEKRSEGGLLSRCCLKDLNLADIVPHFSKSDGNRIHVVKCLIEMGASPNGYGDLKESPINLCLKSEDYELVYLLLKNGGNAKSFSVTSGDTPLHAALHIVSDKKDDIGLHILKHFLDEYSADPAQYDYLNPNTQDHEGNTLLHMIFQKNSFRHHEDIMNMLVKFDINKKLKNNQDREATFQVSGKDPRLVYWNKILPRNKKKQDTSSKSQRTKTVKTVINSKNSKPKVVEPADEPELKNTEAKSKKGENVQQGEVECKLVTVRDSLVYEIEKLIQQGDWSCTSPCVDISGSMALRDKDNIDYAIGSSANYTEKTSVKSESSKETDLMEDPEAEATLEENEPDDVLKEDCFQALDFDNMTWEIECTSEVLKKLGSKEVQLHTRNKIVQVIQQLGNGDWTVSLQKKLKHLKSEIKLYEAKLDKGARMMWELAIDFSPRCSENPEKIIEMEQASNVNVRATGRVYSEMIRIWDIVLDHNKLNHAIDTICQAYNRGLSCVLRKKLKGLNRGQFSSNLNTEKRIPLCFVDYDESQTMEEDVTPEFCPPASAVETEYNIMKFHSFSTNMALNILSNMDTKVEYPFRVGELEYAIIDLCPKPLEAIILIGRSGTGKTTCCLYRLWKQYQKYWVKAEQAGEPLLVKVMWPKQTLSQGHGVEDAQREVEGSTNVVESECHESDEEIDTISSEEEVQTCDGACSAVVPAVEDIVESHIDNDAQQDINQLEHLHQIFVTKNHVLCKEVQKNFIELSKSTKATIHYKPLDSNIYRLQDIKDEHFPLFITSQQLLLLLDASLPDPFFPRNPDGSLKKSIVGWSSQDEMLIPELQDDDEEEELEDEMDEEENVMEIQMRETDPRQFVTYEVFAYEIWPKMVKGKPHCNPALVWKEIKSFLKGSFEAYSSPGGTLSEEQYNKLGRKRAPNFQEDRTEIYRLFRLYQQIKSQWGFFDEEDVLHNLSIRLAKLDEIPWSIHELYGDEIQDFTQAELCMLMKIINDPNSMFLTGDTAQSIMKGVAFRFSDLRSLFYYASKSNADKKKRSLVRKPKRIYQLYQNYRSHSGILNLASGIVDLLQFFFPESFDRLPRDRGLFDGPKPTVLESCSVSDLAILLRGNKRKSQPIEFGAHQVVLVANETAKETIPEELTLALVLTIYEAKGLEFDDVLLYNFFTDSQAGKEWRVISSFSHTSAKASSSGPVVEVPLEEAASVQTRPLEFNADLHKMLNDELKQLYTAVTRARVNLWLFDENREKRGPAFEYLIKGQYVQVVKTDENTDLDDSMFVKSSTQIEWIERGDYFAKHQCWKVAAKCYQKGGSADKEKLALANFAVLNVQYKKVSPKEMQLEYLQLSKTYLECGVPKLSMKCLKNAKEYKLCAQLCESLGKMKEAAVLYRKAECYKFSAKCFEKASEYEMAMKMYCMAELFDEAAEVLERWDLKETKVPYTEKYFYLEAAARYHKQKNLPKMEACLSKLSPDDQLVFLKENGYLTQAAGVLKMLQREEDAATLMREYGYLTKAAEFSNRLEYKAECLLAYARIQSREKKLDALQKEEVRKVLGEALQMFRKTQQPYGEAEVTLLEGLFTKQIQTVRHAFEMFLKESHTAGALEALCTLLSHSVLMVSNLSQYLTCIAMVLKLVKALAKPENNEEKEMVKSCFDFYGIIQIDDSQSRIPKNDGARILQFILNDNASLKENTISELTSYRLNTNDVKSVLKSHLLRKLYICAKEMISGCQAVPNVCLKYVCGLDCKLENCTDLHKPLQRHEARSAIHSKVYLTALNGMLLEAKKLCKENSLPEVEDFQNILTGDEYALCKSLIRTVFPKHFHQRVVSDNSVACKEILSLTQNVPFESYRMVLRDYISKRFKDENDFIRRESTDLWLEATKVYLLSSDFPDKLDKLLSKEENLYQNELNTNTQRKGKAGMLQVTKGKQQHFNFFRLFLMMIRELYKNPEQCIHTFYRFLNVPVRKCKQHMIPDIGNTVMLIEFQFVLTCAFLMHFCKNVVVCLPKSYLALLHFWEFMLKNKPWCHVVHSYKPRDVPHFIKKLKSHLCYLAEVMSGHVNEDFNVLVDAFSDSEYTGSGEAERSAVLCLVMLVNAGQVLDSRCETYLRYNFITAKEELMKLQDPGQVSKRIMRVVNSVNTSRNIKDVVEALEVLLKERDDEYLMDCRWDSFNKDIHFRTVTVARFNYILLPISLSSPSSDKSPAAVYEEDIEESEYHLQVLRAEQHRINWRVAIRKCILVNRAIAIMQDKSGDGHIKRMIPKNFIKADIDTTQCDLCGIRFGKNLVKPSDEQTGEELEEENLETEEGNEEHDQVADNNEISFKEDYQTHLSSEKHRLQQDCYEKYLHYFAEHADPLITSSKKVLEDLDAQKAGIFSMGEQSKVVEGKLKNSLQNVMSSMESIYKTKNWASGIEKLSQKISFLSAALHEAKEDLRLAETGMYANEGTGDFKDNSLEDDAVDEPEKFEELTHNKKRRGKKGKSGKRRKY
nr:PREDICTED: TPR and ankyrin repeat-containing protein 1 isoform X1 [Lepisosteus oculatus]